MDNAKRVVGLSSKATEKYSRGRPWYSSHAGANEVDSLSALAAQIKSILKDTELNFSKTDGIAFLV